MSAKPSLVRPTASDWAQHRSLITELWVEKSQSRKKIQACLAEERLAVSVKMILDQIQKWGLDRKNKQPEMAAAARIMKQRGGAIEHEFVTIRRRRVYYTEVCRFAKRKGLSFDALAQMAPQVTPKSVQAPSTGSAAPHTPQIPVKCQKRTIPSLADPDLWRCSRYLLISLEAFTTREQISIAHAKYVMSRHPGYQLAISSSHPDRPFNEIHEILFYLASACQHAHAQKPDLSNEMAPAMDLAPKVVAAEDLAVTVYFIPVLGGLCVHGYIDLGASALRHLYEIAKIYKRYLQASFYKSCLTALESGEFPMVAEVVCRNLDTRLANISRSDREPDMDVLAPKSLLEYMVRLLPCKWNVEGLRRSYTSSEIMRWETIFQSLNQTEEE